MSSQLTMDLNSAATPPAKLRLSPAAWTAIAAGVVGVAFLIFHSLTSAHHAEAHAEAPHLWGLGILPFLAILGCIAVLPLIKATHHWWESNLNRLGVALCCGLATVVYYVLVSDLPSVITLLEHAIVAEYIPFIVLLFSLYVISGGISLSGDLAARPLTNCGFLAVGAAIASFIGTTGASMLLIRPLLQTNHERKYKVHTVIFFIFLVSNIGGSLLPIGDPPLFLGYLYGVPFFWTMGLWPQWLVTCVILLAIYFVWDTLAYRKESKKDILEDETDKQPLRLRGAFNIVWLAGVVLAVAFVVPGKPFPLLGFTVFPFLREILMLGCVAAAWLTTKPAIRQANKFNFAAIGEVAALFVGIFIAMQIPIMVLKAYGPSLTANFMDEPWHFFWATGVLSSFLDNAPTYVVFFELAKTMVLPEGADTVALGDAVTIGAQLLTAISLGAVFMGAMTYIGNGPNFMVKAIAEQTGVSMPSFFGYMFKYSIPILIPVFVLVCLVML